MSVADPPEPDRVPADLLNAVRAVYRERTSESVQHLREVAMRAGCELHPELQNLTDGPKFAAHQALCAAINIVAREVQPVVLNLYAGLFEG